MRQRKDDAAASCREKFGSDWAAAVNSAEFWEKMADPDFVSDEELWALRYSLRREMIEFVRRRLLLQHQRLAPGDFIRFDHLLNPDALTIGFARRFATYKRAPLIFQQFDNIVKLARDKSGRSSSSSPARRIRAMTTASGSSSKSFTSAGTANCTDTWCSSKTTTSTSRARWCPAATSG